MVVRLMAGEGQEERGGGSARCGRAEPGVKERWDRVPRAGAEPGGVAVSGSTARGGYPVHGREQAVCRPSAADVVPGTSRALGYPLRNLIG